MPTDQNDNGIDDQSLAPTPVTAWGKVSVPEETGFIVTLPSGNIAKMRRTLDLPILLESGKIPNPLADIVQGMMDTGATSFPPEANDSKTLKQLYRLLNETVVRCFIEPRVSMPDPQEEDESDEDHRERLSHWRPEPDTLSIFQIEPTDQMYVFSVAQGAAANLKSFRAESAAAMGDVQDSESLRDAAQRTSGAVGNRAQRRAVAKKSSPAKKTAAKR